MQTLKMILKDLEWSRSPAERDLFLGSFRQPSESNNDYYDSYLGPLRLKIESHYYD